MKIEICSQRSERRRPWRCVRTLHPPRSVVFLFFLFLCFNLFAGDPSPVLWSYRNRTDRIVDVLPYQEHTMCILYERRGPVLIDSKTFEEKSLELSNSTGGGRGDV